jgi:hypothetical protein
MLMNVEHLARTLTTLSNTVQAIESRQTDLDHRSAEINSRMQGLQEGYSTLAERQDMVADAMQQKRLEEEFAEAMEAAPSQTNGGHQRKSGGDHKLCETRLDEHERRLTKLSVDVTLLANRVAGTRSLEIDGTPKVAKESSLLADRLVELEKGQKKVLGAANKALKMAMDLQQQERHQLQQQESLDKLLSDSLRPALSGQYQFSQSDAANLAIRVDEQDKVLSELRLNYADLGNLREHVEELHQAVISNLAQTHATDQSDAVSHPGSTPSLVESSGRSDGLVTIMQTVQARMDRNLKAMSNRLDSLQEVRDQQRVQSLQASRQVPDMAQKMDQLWTQCQFYFSKVKEHDVHIGLMCTNVENDTMSWLECDNPSRQQQLPYTLQRYLENAGAAAPSVSRGEPTSRSLTAPPPGYLTGCRDAVAPSVSDTASAAPHVLPASPAEARSGLQAITSTPLVQAATSVPASPSTAGFPVSQTSRTSALDEDDDGSLELFGSSSVFNESQSVFKVQRNVSANDFCGR